MWAKDCGTVRQRENRKAAWQGRGGGGCMCVRGVVWRASTVRVFTIVTQKRTAKGVSKLQILQFTIILISRVPLFALLVAAQLECVFFNPWPGAFIFCFESIKQRWGAFCRLLYPGRASGSGRKERGGRMQKKGKMKGRKSALWNPTFSISISSSERPSQKWIFFLK